MLPPLGELSEQSVPITCTTNQLPGASESVRSRHAGRTSEMKDLQDGVPSAVGICSKLPDRCARC